jgi:hypothetical protein
MVPVAGGIMPDIFTADERREIHEAYFDAMSDPRPYVPATLREWQARAQALRPALSRTLGLDPAPADTPLDVRVTGSLQRDGYTIDRVAYQTWPGFYATGWLYRPATLDEPAPAILNPHGHWQDGARNPTVQARLIGLARRGYVALAVDSLHVTDFPIGLCSLTVMTWNNLRGIDLLQSLPEVDGERIGCTGASGGGQQTMYAAALDDRIKATVNVCLVTHFKKILFSDERTHCECNHVPGLMALTDEPEICGLIAPRPSLYLCVTGDWTADFPTDEYPDMQRMYDLHGAGDAIDVEQWDCGHDYHAEMRSRMYAWFARHLGIDEPSDLAEREEDLLPADTLNDLDGPVPSSRPWTDFPMFYREQHAGDAGPLTPDALQRLLGEDRRSLHARRAPHVDAHGDHVVLGATGVPIPVTAHAHGGSECKGLALVLHPDGRQTVGADDARTLQEAGWDVLLADVRLRGELAIRWGLNTVVWGRPEIGMAVDDIANLLDSRANAYTQVACVGLGEMGWVAVCAAVMDSRITQVLAPGLSPRFLDGPDAVSLPNLLRCGTADDLLALVAGRLVDVGDDDWATYLA